MADLNEGADPTLPQLNLTADEKRVFGQLFQQADTENIGVVTGEVAVKFFERTKLAPSVLGEIWQIADTENRGLLTKPGFCVVLRLIGHYQAGRDPTPALAMRQAPLPKFEGLNTQANVPPPPGPPPTLQPQSSGGPIRVPPLAPEKANEFASLFEKSGAQNGILPGETAKSIFEKARLPNDVLGRIWNLADTEQRGALNVTEFIIAMHLLTSYKSGAMRALPQLLPPGLYEAASRRAPASAIPRQFSGPNGPQRGQSPVLRPPYGTPPQTTQSTGSDWLVNPQEKSKYDSFFSKLDVERKGYITGEQAVRFFSDSGLPEEILASIWDLADINSEGQLNQDEFAVAMYLIRQQRGSAKPELPTAIPAALIPPSMRMQQRPAQQPTAPAFDNAAYSSQLPKSASEDLFGLDAFSSSAPEQVNQSTGGSVPASKAFDSDPFAGSKATSPTSPQSTGFQPQTSNFQQPQARNPASIFKPFQPTSSFGQGLTSQGTGGSNRGPQQQPPPSSVDDDLLGDNDPEVSKKLTSETTELANMSNQISTLRNQMQDVQAKKSATENDLSASSTQKRDLAVRLSQFRSQYEQEVQQVKSLEERLNTSRTETRKLQQEIAMIEGTYQDLQTQHRQVTTALETDQRENASLKERIRQLNSEIAQLRPQLDKMRSDARQQKGMVAINKKQVSTTEGERNKMKGEIDDLTKVAQENTRSQQPLVREPSSSVVSPAPSTASQSTNPFFRKQSGTGTERTISPAATSREPPVPQTQNNFDSVFGPSFSTTQTSAPPQTSFRTEPSVPSHTGASGPSVVSSEGPGYPTPSTSPPGSSYRDSPQVNEPPAPPESRQINSTNLPFRTTSRTDSLSSSVRVAPPVSRHEPAGGSDTPTLYGTSPVATPSQETSSNRAFSSFERNSTASPAASATSDGTRPTLRSTGSRDVHAGVGPTTATMDTIPGAFPSEPTPPTVQAAATGGSTFSDKAKAVADSIRQGEVPKDDFDAAFADFGPPRPASERSQSATGASDAGAPSRFNREFPPIEEINRQEESDSESERGFDDNFTSASPQPKKEQEHSRNISGVSGATGGSHDGASDLRPPLSQMASTISEQLPTPGAQKSPPPYESAVPSKANGRTDSNIFPPEFGGLLPAREDPTSSPETSRSPERSFSGGMTSGQVLFGGSGPSRSTAFDSQTFSNSPPPADTPASTTNSEAYHSAASHPSGGDRSIAPTNPPPQTIKSAFNDDFDAGFDDLTEAKEDDKGSNDDFMFSSQHRSEGFDDFNPVFDSPAASKSTTVASQHTPTGVIDNSFHDFESNIGSSTQTFGGSAGKAPQQPQPAQSHDWDAIFSGLDAPQDNKTTDLGFGDRTSDSNKVTSSTFDDDKTPTASLNLSGSSSANLGASNQQKDLPPPLGRAISTGTEHDDPILKKLTGMGYPRNEALNALEKFDYDINAAADFLTSDRR